MNNRRCSYHSGNSKGFGSCVPETGNENQIFYFVTVTKAFRAEIATEYAEDSLVGALGLRPWCLAMTVHGASSQGASHRGLFPGILYLSRRALLRSHAWLRGSRAFQQGGWCCVMPMLCRWTHSVLHGTGAEDMSPAILVHVDGPCAAQHRKMPPGGHRAAGMRTALLSANCFRSHL